MSNRMNLCLNCLESGAKGVDVGFDKGTQRDPYRESVQLCPPCTEALLNGHFMMLAGRYRTSRRIDRGVEITDAGRDLCPCYAVPPGDCEQHPAA